VREGTAEVTSWGDPRTYVRFDFWGDYDLQVGDMVTLTDEFGTSTSHEVQPLSITDVDINTNTVTGTANIDAVLQVWVHEQSYPPLDVAVASDGTWQADLTEIFDITYGTGGRAWVITQGGNATAVDWYVPNPHFTVFPEWEFFDGLDWPDGAIVSISVAGKPECSLERESWGGFFNGNFGEGCDIETSDVVTFTDGETTRTHTVQNLMVTKVNQDDDTVKGIADPGAEVYVWPHATGEQLKTIAKTQGMAKGTWNVDFSGIYDLVPGECGRSEIRDEFANSTAVDWCISKPRIVASESGDWLWTMEFKPGDLDIFIYDSPDVGANLLWSGQQVADERGFAFVGSDLHGQDLVPGNYLVVSDGDSQKSLILRPISVTIFDTENDFMAGFAPAGSEVAAHAGPQDWQKRIMTTADPVTGEWFADFAQIGFDITEDMRTWSYAHIYDEDGDANEGSTPPPPVIFAHPAYNFIEGTQWTPGAEATVMIDDPTNGEGIDYSDTQMVDSDSWVRFGLEFDLQASHIITMTDGHNTQTMIVSNLRVTGFNLDEHNVFGVGDPGSEFYVADNGMTVPVDDEGNWSVSFDELLPGTWWTIIQAYPDGNEVRETFRVPLPVILANPASDVIEGHEWTPGGEVIITIDDPTNGEGVDYTQTEIASDEINYLYDTRVYFNLEFDLQAGHTITMTDGQYTQMMIVSNLQVMGFDLGTHTVFGVGDAYSEVYIVDNGMTVPVDDEGNWSVSFDELLPGTWWTIIQAYPDGNEVRETFFVPG
jgi:hypothetical protein